METSKKIKSLTQHLSQTIDDFRNLSSDEKKRVPFNIHSTLNEAHNIVHKSFSNNNIAYELNVQEDGTFDLVGYHRELLQVILNIFNNSKDVLLQKSITPAKVWINLESTPHSIIIEICDNGGGIPTHVIDKIFEPYYTTKHQSIGTGIGLYMSRKIITEHFKGTIEASNSEEGAVFKIILPREEAL